MATIKSYTDINQSKKLAEILPIESADMYYISGDKYDVNFGSGVYEEIADWLDDGTPRPADIPCWSLAALLNVLSEYTLKSNKFYGKVALWCQGISVEYDNPVDACVAMIEQLHKLNLL